MSKELDGKNEVSKTPSHEELLRQQLELLAKREAREQAEWEEKQQEKAAKAENHKMLRERKDKESSDARNMRMVKQSRCRHEKGEGAFKKGLPEHNIYCHFLPDQSVFIRCIGCGMTWFQHDDRDWLYRKNAKGQDIKVKNHTGKSFADMSQLLPKDAVSRSEIAVVFAPQPIAPAVTE